MKYYLLELKFLGIVTNLDRIVLIADDIESAYEEFQKFIILLLLSVKNCLLNTGSQYSRPYTVNVCISLRPATYANLRRDPQIDGFTKGQVHRLEYPAELDEIFRKRFGYILRNIGKKLE